MNNPTTPDPPIGPPEAVQAWRTTWRPRMNKYGLRDHKDRPQLYAGLLATKIPTESIP